MHLDTDLIYQSHMCCSFQQGDFCLPTIWAGLQIKLFATNKGAVPLFTYLSILHPIALVLFLIPFDFKNILIASLAVEIYVGQIYLRRGLFCKGRFMQIC